MQPPLCHCSCVESLVAKKGEMQSYGNNTWEESKVKNSICGEGEKIAQSVQQQKKKKNRLVCCLHYSISDLIIISAGGGRDEQKCRQSPEASPQRALALVDRFATVFFFPFPRPQMAQRDAEPESSYI